MKDINNYIFEKLKINKTSKVDKNDINHIVDIIKDCEYRGIKVEAETSKEIKITCNSSWKYENINNLRQVIISLICKEYNDPEFITMENTFIFAPEKVLALRFEKL